MSPEEIHHAAVSLRADTNKSLDKCRNAYIFYDGDYERAKMMLESLSKDQWSENNIKLFKTRGDEEIKM